MLILITHIIIAIAGIVSSGIAYLSPSQARLNLSYGLVAGTLASGTYLVISTSSDLVSSCVTGLVYLAGVSLAIIGAKNKLAVVRAKNTD